LQNVGQHIHAVELSVGCNAVEFINQLRNFDLDLHSVFSGINSVGSLNGQFPDPVKNICSFLQIAFGCLDKRNSILDVSFSLIQTADLASQFLGYGQS
jgi:hypothetical protein